MKPIKNFKPTIKEMSIPKKINNLAEKIKQRLENNILERQPKQDYLDLSLEETYGIYRVGDKFVKSILPR